MRVSLCVWNMVDGHFRGGGLVSQSNSQQSMCLHVPFLVGCLLMVFLFSFTEQQSLYITLN